VPTLDLVCGARAYSGPHVTRIEGSPR
jgi:hypothetical protein